MKKTLVAAVLALAGLSSLVFADKNVFVDSWVGCYPSMWMGEKQDNYGSDSTLHSIKNAEIEYSGNLVSSFTYNKGAEAWAGRVVQAGGGSTLKWNLTGFTELKFKVAKPAGGPNVTLEKFYVTDANNREFFTGQIVINTSDFSQEISIALPADDANLTEVNQLLGFTIKALDNGGGTDSVTFFIDEARFIGGNKGEVIVKIIGGKRGISLGNRINFGAVTAGSVTNSASLEGDKYFLITNIGDIVGSSETVKLNLVNPAGWTAVQNVAVRPLVNKYALDALFNVGAPADADFVEANDALSTLPAVASATRFAGNQTGTNILPGQTRNLYLKFFAPDQTSTSAETKINIEVGF